MHEVQVAKRQKLSNNESAKMLQEFINNNPATNLGTLNEVDDSSAAVSYFFRFQSDCAMMLMPFLDR
jgi:hypothetical protein